MQVIFSLSTLDDPKANEAIDSFYNKIGFAVEEAHHRCESEKDATIIEPEGIVTSLKMIVGSSISKLMNEVYRTSVDNIKSPEDIVVHVEHNLEKMLKDVSESIQNGLAHIQVHTVDPEEQNTVDGAVFTQLNLNEVYDEEFADEFKKAVKELGSVLRNTVMWELDKVAKFAALLDQNKSGDNANQ